MKVSRIIATMMALAMIAASCQKTDDPKTDPEPVPEKKSEACKLLSLKVVSGTNSRECSIYEKEKEVDIFILDGYDLTNLTIITKVSDKASCSVDSTKTYNVLSDLTEIVVTAEDGEHTSTYSLNVREPEIEFEVNPVWSKTAGEVGVKAVSSQGSSVAFAGTDKIVIYGGDIISVETGAKVGTLCTDGVDPNAKMYNLANDVNGIVISNFVVGDITTETIEYGYTLAWLDGPENAPTVIYTNANGDDAEKGDAFQYMSCGGDVKGDFILTSLCGHGEFTNHHCFQFKNGDYANPTWRAFQTGYSSVDGNWGQILSPTTGNLDGWFAIGDSMGNYDGYGNCGYHVYTRKGVADLGEDNELWGTTWPDGLIPDGYGDNPYQRFYGNLSFGTVRGFQFKGVDYLIAATTGWPCGYITIQSMIPDLDERDDPELASGHYLLRTQQLDGAYPDNIPSAAFIFDEAEGRGLVLVNIGTCNMYLYEITGDLL